MVAAQANLAMENQAQVLASPSDMLFFFKDSSSNTLVGVYDRHGGADVSRFLRSRLFPNVGPASRFLRSRLFPNVQRAFDCCFLLVSAFSFLALDCASPVL